MKRVGAGVDRQARDLYQGRSRGAQAAFSLRPDGAG